MFESRLPGKFSRFLVGSTSLVVLSHYTTQVVAHPGHELLPVPSYSPLHYVLEPLHILPAIVGGIIIAATAWKWLRSGRGLRRGRSIEP